jgi:hypothetical protein
MVRMHLFELPRRVAGLLKAGDTGGALIWRRIVAAIEELRRERREGELFN